jgi:hypothetical protein
MTALFALLLFAVIGAGVIAVAAALGSHADRTLAEWDDAEAAHDELNQPW